MRSVDPGSPDRGVLAVSIGGWSVRVSVEPTRVRGLAISVGPARAVRKADSRVWLEHELVFQNLGRRALQLTGTRSAAAFIGPTGHRRRLLASAGLCGYAREQPGSRLTPACLAMLDVTTLEPGASQRGSITLFKGLRGMEPFVAGDYVFDLRFMVEGRSQAADTGMDAAVKIVYEIQPTLGDGGL